MGITIYEPAPTPSFEGARQHAVSTSGALGARHDAVLEEIAERSRRTLGFDMAAVTIIHRDWVYLIAAAGVTNRTSRRDLSLCGHAIMNPRVVFVVGDVQADARFADSRLSIDGMRVGSYAGAVLTDSAQMPLGTLCVFGQAPRASFGAYDQMLLLGLAKEATRRLGELRPH